jgi:hypothetical protein
VFANQTTLILGAGASNQFSFPLGESIYNELIVDIDYLKKYVKGKRSNAFLNVGEFNAEEFKRQPLVSICSYLLRSSADYMLHGIASPAQSMFDFGDALKKQTHDSPDRFIRDNPEFA